LTLLLDCCFGGGNEKMFSPSGRELGSVITPKRWAPPTEFLAKHAIFGKAEAASISSYKPFGMRPVTARPEPSVVLSKSGSTSWPTAIDEEGQPLVNGVLIAACTEDETASASNELTEGLSAFTFALKRLVEQQGHDLSLQDVRDGTDRILKGLRFRQTSTLKIGTGPVDRDSRFLSLQRKTTIPSWPTDRRLEMTDTKFLDRIVPVLVERAISELTKKGYQPASSGSDKSLGGDIVRDLADRVVRS
jgi:hypothetical protein